MAAIIHDARCSRSPSWCGRRARRPRWRCATSASTPSCAPATRSCARRAPGWSPPATTARRRIERDLHDGAQQRFVSLALTLRLARNSVEAGSTTAALLDGAIDELSSRPRRAARAGPRHPPRGAHRARARAGARGPRRALAGAGDGLRRARRPRCRRRSRRAAYFVVCRGAHQRRQVRATRPPPRSSLEHAGGRS